MGITGRGEYTEVSIIFPSVRPADDSVGVGKGETWFGDYTIDFCLASRGCMVTRQWCSWLLGDMSLPFCHTVDEIGLYCMVDWCGFWLDRRAR